MEKENLCRACMLECGEFQDLFTYDDVIEQPLMEVLRICTDITVTFDDHFPKIICDDCVLELRMAFNFREKCQTTDETYKKRLSQINSINCVMETPTTQTNTYFDNEMREETTTPLKCDLTKILQPETHLTNHSSQDEVSGVEEHHYPTHCLSIVKTENETYSECDYSNECSDDSYQSFQYAIEESKPKRPYNSDLTFIRRLPPDVQLLVRRALEAERKRKERSLEGLEEKQRRLALKFGVYVPPQEQLAHIRLQNAARQRKRRANETPEERERRLCADAERKRRFRHMMKLHSDMKTQLDMQTIEGARLALPPFQLNEQKFLGE